MTAETAKPEIQNHRSPSPERTSIENFQADVKFYALSPDPKPEIAARWRRHEKGFLAGVALYISMSAVSRKLRAAHAKYLASKTRSPDDFWPVYQAQMQFLALLASNGGKPGTPGFEQVRAKIEQELNAFADGLESNLVFDETPVRFTPWPRWLVEFTAREYAARLRVVGKERSEETFSLAF